MVEDGKEGGLKRWEGNIGVCLRVLFLAVIAGAFACSLASMSECNFFIFEPRDPPSGIVDTRPDLLLNISIATVGLYRYDPNYEGCREITDDFDQLSGQFTAARAGASLAAIFGVSGLGLLLVDLLCCRFPCSRLLISLLFVFAFVAQALTFLVFAAPICDPNYKNGPFPCSPDTATWVSVSACILYVMSACFACCFPKPVPVLMRVKKSMQDDETDSCFAIFAKKPEEKEKEGDVEAGTDEEKALAAGSVKASGSVKAQPEAEPQPELTDEQLQEQHAEQLQNQQAEAAVAAALATVRRGKQEEIEKQLELLTKYKDNLSEEEYNEKMTKLLHALPDPDTYDTYTKTDALVVLPAEEKEADTEEGGDSDAAEEGEGEEEEGDEKEEEQKKSIGKTITSTISSGVTSVKKTVGLGGSSKTPAPAPAPAPAQADTGSAPE